MVTYIKQKITIQEVEYSLKYGNSLEYGQRLFIYFARSEYLRSKCIFQQSPLRMAPYYALLFSF